MKLTAKTARQVTHNDGADATRPPSHGSKLAPPVAADPRWDFSDKTELEK